MSRGPADGSPVGRGRRTIAVSKITAAVVQLERDGADRPPAMTTLMGMVRLMAPIILAHKNSGWTDPQIVALLNQHGFDISVGTLTVYRNRLKQEREGRDELTPPDASRRGSAPPADTFLAAQGADAPSPTAAATPLPRSRTPADAQKQARFNSRVDFDDTV